MRDHPRPLFSIRVFGKGGDSGDSGDNVDFKGEFLSPPWIEVVTGGDTQRIVKFELPSGRHPLGFAVTEAEGPRFVSLHDEHLYQCAGIAGCNPGSPIA